MLLRLSTEQGIFCDERGSCIEFGSTRSAPIQGVLATNSPTPWRTRVASDVQPPAQDCTTMAHHSANDSALLGRRQAWLLEQTERISEAAESADLRPFWSLVCALQEKRKRLVPRPVRDDAGHPARDHAEAFFCFEFGHRVKQGDLVSRSRCCDVGCPAEVPTATDVCEAVEPLVGQLKVGKMAFPNCVRNESLRGAELHWNLCRPRWAGAAGKVLPCPGGVER